MNHKPIHFCVVACFALFGCRPRNQSIVKEEGLFIAGDRSLSKVVARMAGEYKWDAATQISALATLKKVVPATFNIYCSDSSGTGVFTGPQGEFITAAHVLANTRFCHFQLLKLVNDDIVQAEDRYGLIAIDQTKMTVNRFDVSKGHIDSVQSPNFVKYAKSFSGVKGEYILNLGFPGATNRDGTTIFYNGQELDANTNSDLLFEALCGDTATKDRMSEIHKWESVFEELAELSQTVIQACAIAKDERPHQHKVSYDLLPKAVEISLRPLVLGYGKLAWFDANNGIATSDAYHGMSGGPLVDLSSGSLIAINKGVVTKKASTNKDNVQISDLQDISAFFYSGVLMVQLISDSRLLNLRPPEDMRRKTWTPDVLKNCMQSIRSDKNQGTFVRLEETAGIVQMAFFADGKTYGAKISSAVAGETTYYRVSTAQNSVIEFQLSFDAAHKESYPDLIRDRQRTGASFVPLQVDEINLTPLQTLGVVNNLENYWPTLIAATNEYLKRSNFKGDALARLLANRQVAGEFGNKHLKESLATCSPTVRYDIRKLVQGFFGL